MLKDRVGNILLVRSFADGSLDGEERKDGYAINNAVHTHTQQHLLLGNQQLLSLLLLFLSF